MTDNTVTNGSTISWASLNLSEVTPEPMERTEVPSGNYKFRLVGAKASPYQAGATDLDLVITEGAQAKRHVFSSLPTPDKGKWVVQAAANLFKQLGGTKGEGEDLIDALNRIAPTANQFTADVEENFYQDRNTGEQKQGRPRIRLFSITAA